jgi:transposase
MEPFIFNVFLGFADVAGIQDHFTTIFKPHFPRQEGAPVEEMTNNELILVQMFAQLRTGTHWIVHG